MVNVRNNTFNYTDKDLSSLKGFVLVNKWEGIVEEVTKCKVYVRMYDFGTESEDFAVFDIHDFEGAFLVEKVKEGERFFFYVGYIDYLAREHIGLMQIKRLYAKSKALVVTPPPPF